MTPPILKVSKRREWGSDSRKLVINKREMITLNRWNITIYKGVSKTNLHDSKLIEYLIKTYSNENDIVLDNTMGSGTTGIGCINTNRKFIGIELNEEYYNMATDRIIKHLEALSHDSE